ncbi:transcriptional regulator [Candidatus Dojkabacteria bacterium]|uniref:Transcriptional regulator n=1 Tax=Candidatus Dojkabacteria bacterium TaxID=2099670 RepID=A0A5C7J3N0_9BACT|nr:MAG: transcriptional regulator [Candidatus Dojkabacteria bacterium]
MQIIMESLVLTPQQQYAVDIFSSHHGIMKTSQALLEGIYQKTLYALKERGIIEPLTRGVFHLVDYEFPPHLDLVTISLRHPETIFCLITALDFHNITTVIPRAIYIALPQGAKLPQIDGHKIRAFYYTKTQLETGVEIHEIAGIKIKIFSPEKTVVDCFKYANKTGLDVAIEALKMCIADKGSKPTDFLKFARIARVNRKMQPYLQALYD